MLLMSRKKFFNESPVGRFAAPLSLDSGVLGSNRFEPLSWQHPLFYRNLAAQRAESQYAVRSSTEEPAAYKVYMVLKAQTVTAPDVPALRHPVCEPDIISFGIGGRLWMRGSSDEDLMRLVADSGDEAALSELYDRYSSLIFGAGIRYLGERGQAEDLTQDVFMAVWRSAGSFDPSRASFATWVFRITRNRATDLIRRRRARPRTVDDTSAPEAGEKDPSAALSRSFDVAAGLSRISPAHREVLTLAYFEGLSQREISERTGAPLGTVKSRTTAALRALREGMMQENRWSDNRWSEDE